MGGRIAQGAWLWLAAGAAALTLGVGSALAQTAPAPAATVPPVFPVPPAERLIALAQADTRALDITEDLTTETGPRLAGSPDEARARDWAVARLRAEGFREVRVETFPLTFWGRVSESLRVTGRFSQPLEARAIGGSISTPPGGLEAEVVRFADLAALRAAPPGSLTGRIAFVDEVMVRRQDGAGYGQAVAKRRECAPLAAERGAVGCLVRSAGTSARHAHVGQGARQARSPIPAMVLANADADQLARLLQRGPQRVRMDVQTEFRENAVSGNVIAEIRGTHRPDEIVVLGCHLDSWDLSTGALDDAIGCGMVTAAVLNARAVAGPPRRTIRVIWYGAEEVGVIGGADYARRAQAAGIERHVFAAESDAGADLAFALDVRFGPEAAPLGDAIARSLAPLGIMRGSNTANGAPDIVPLRNLGVPIVDLRLDLNRYFDIHHTPDDTFNQVRPDSVRQNVAAWSIIAWWAGWTDIDFRTGRPAGQ